jgi:hypothetical protein
MFVVPLDNATSTVHAARSTLAHTVASSAAVTVVAARCVGTAALIACDEGDAQCIVLVYQCGVCVVYVCVCDARQWQHMRFDDDQTNFRSSE